MATALTDLRTLPGPRHLKFEALGQQITELCACIYAATYKLLVLIRQFDEQGGWHQPGLCSCAHWLNFQCGIGMNAAREKVRVAHALKDLPLISTAFEKGEVSYSKVRAMTRIADESNEDYLLMIARHGTAWHMEQLVSKYRRAKRQQETDTANEQHKHRELQHYYDADGCMVIRARLPAEQGALIVKALELAMDNAFKEPVEAAVGAGPARDSRSESPAGAGSHKGASAETREPIGARRADALAEMAESYLNNDDNPGSSADRYQVVVHVSAETSHLDDGPRVSAETSRRIACDCSALKLVEDADGEPLSIGRKSRSIPPAIRRALRFRDKGCRFPGCTRQRFVDGHHIRHWADGGETSLENLVLLCRHHHRLVHEGGYGCERTSDGKIVFTAPDEQVLPESAELPGVDPDRELNAWLHAAMTAFDIDPETCRPHWYAGDTMDWHMAVGALFPSPSYPSRI